LGALNPLDHDHFLWTGSDFMNDKTSEKGCLANTIMLVRIIQVHEETYSIKINQENK
jgi:hypothetical protein